MAQNRNVLTQRSAQPGAGNSGAGTSAEPPVADSARTPEDAAESLYVGPTTNDALQSLRELLDAALSLNALATDAPEQIRFARRNLAELLIEDNPWQAALQLRHLARETPKDDSVHALMGLCQALLGNYRAAVAAYERALGLAPDNPWYHHNVGHLLDVALEDAERARGHLEAAHEEEPLEHEIAASLAHCLGRLDEIGRAHSLATDALRANPENKDHAALVEWLEAGAPKDRGPHTEFSVHNPETRDESEGSVQPERAPDPGFQALEAGFCEKVGELVPPAERVTRTLVETMSAAGQPEDRIQNARSLWDDFCTLSTAPGSSSPDVRVQKPESFAAAVEYALSVVNDGRSANRTAVARRYGVHRRTLTARYDQLSRTLDLLPKDPRYIDPLAP